jgi:hypothetical protein
MLASRYPPGTLPRFSRRPRGTLIDKISEMDLQRLRNLPQGNDRRVALPQLKRAYIGTIHAHKLRHRLLREVGGKAQPPDILADEQASIHARQAARLSSFVLRIIVLVM